MGLEQHPHPAVNICPSCWCYRDERITRGDACKLGTGQDSCCLSASSASGSTVLLQGCTDLSVPGWENERSLVLCCPLKQGLSLPKMHSDSSGQLCHSYITASLEEAAQPWHSCCLTAVVWLAHFAKGWREIDWEELSHCADDTDWMEWKWHGVTRTEQNRIYF